MARRYRSSRWSRVGDRYYSDYGWRPYVPVASRRLDALREAQQLTKKGRVLAPVRVEGRAIAQTFWGRAWCDNLERYSDFANRLPRGRTYVRNGSVLDLQLSTGRVTALVSGSTLYAVEATIAAVPAKRWKAVCADCAGAIDSIVELLQGRFSTAVMERLCREQTGLFPTPKEIAFTCSCPDWASMCKHVAAVLYGIGRRLDDQPDLLFTLRQVEARDLIVQAATSLPRASARAATGKVLEADDLGELFGIDLAATDAPSKKGPKKVKEKMKEKEKKKTRVARPRKRIISAKRR